MVRADGETWCAEHHAPSRALSWAGVLIGTSAFSYRPGERRPLPSLRSGWRSGHERVEPGHPLDASALLAVR
jgi:hypothetical protein